MEAVDASNEARLTNSTDPALGNAEPYIIEFNDIGECAWTPSTWSL
jgi:hypothetical protein